MISRVNEKWVQTHGDYRGAIGERYLPALPQPPRPLHRLPMCILKLCGGKLVHDDTGMWHECNTCGRVRGFIDSEQLRATANQIIPQ